MPLRLPTPGPDAARHSRGVELSEVAANAKRPAETPRDFVSAHRVHEVLRARFGSRPTRYRGPGYIYWETAEGVRFPLEDPLAVAGSKAVIRADGSEQLFYSYGYVVSLLRRVDEAERVARAQRGAGPDVSRTH